MRELLEETTIFPTTLASGHDGGGWETVLTLQGRKKKRVWVTRPITTTQDVLSDSDSDAESEESSHGEDAEDRTIPVDDLVTDPYAPPTTLFVNDYVDDSDYSEDSSSESDECDEDSINSSDLEPGEASEMVLRDAVWDADAFFEDYSSSEDSDVDLQFTNPYED